MNKFNLENIKLDSIFHPSDFSEASQIAFAHALKIALVTKSELNILHVSGGENVDWKDFPGVRATLERWSIISKDSPKSAVTKLGVDVNKVMVRGNPVKACLGFMEKHHTDLIVLAIHQAEGPMQWLDKSVGEPMVRKAGQMTLFIPHGVTGFVSFSDGAIHLRNILIPVAGKPSPQPAIEAAARFIRKLNLPIGTVTLLHAGPAAEMPAVSIPDVDGWKWNSVTKSGEPADVILQTAKEVNAGLIMMTSDGPDGFLDALRGTTSERVLRQCRCPLVNLPAGSMLG